jgi:fucose permease
VLLGFLLLVFLDKKELTISNTQSIPLLKLASLLKNKGVLKYTIAASLGAAIEWTFSFWLVSYLINARGINLSFSQLALSVFFGSMLIGRLINSAIAKPQYVQWIMVSSALLGLIGSALFLFTPISIIGVVLIGLALSGMYPLSLGQAISFNPTSSIAVSAVVVECVYFVSMILPVLAGFVSDTQGITVGIGISLVSFIPLLLLLVPNTQLKLD